MGHDETYDQEYERECELASDHDDYEKSVQDMSIEELREDNFKLAAMGCEAPYGDDHGNHRCKSIDYWRTRALLADKILNSYTDFPKIGDRALSDHYKMKEAYNKFIEENKEP